MAPCRLTTKSRRYSAFPATSIMEQRIAENSTRAFCRSSNANSPRLARAGCMEFDRRICLRLFGRRLFVVRIGIGRLRPLARAALSGRHDKIPFEPRLRRALGIDEAKLLAAGLVRGDDDLDHAAALQ